MGADAATPQLQPLPTAATKSLVSCLLIFPLATSIPGPPSWVPPSHSRVSPITGFPQLSIIVGQNAHVAPSTPVQWVSSHYHLDQWQVKLGSECPRPRTSMLGTVLNTLELEEPAGLSPSSVFLFGCRVYWKGLECDFLQVAVAEPGEMLSS